MSFVYSLNLQVYNNCLNLTLLFKCINNYIFCIVIPNEQLCGVFKNDDSKKEKETTEGIIQLDYANSSQFPLLLLNNNMSILPQSNRGQFSRLAQEVAHSLQNSKLYC